MMTPLLLTHATGGSLELTSKTLELRNNPMCVRVDYRILRVFRQQSGF